MADAKTFPIPGRLNLIIAAVQITALLALLRLSAEASGWWLAAVALGYGLVMNSAYAMLHEAQHGILHPDRRINEITGAVLTLFFAAPFHLIRQGHLGLGCGHSAGLRAPGQRSALPRHRPGRCPVGCRP